MTHHLDLGCGAIPRNPYKRAKLSGIDIREGLSNNPDIVIRAANLSTDPIPFETSSFDSVSAYDFLEHIPRVSLDHATSTTRFPVIELMNEVWRVLQPNGLFYAITPVFPHAKAFADPTHVNIMTSKTQRYFTGATPMGKMYGFNGQFALVRQAFIHPRGDYHPLSPSPFLRLKMIGERLTGQSSHMVWEMRAIKN